MQTLSEPLVTKTIFTGNQRRSHTVLLTLHSLTGGLCHRRAQPFGPMPTLRQVCWPDRRYLQSRVLWRFVVWLVSRLHYAEGLLEVEDLSQRWAYQNDETIVEELCGLLRQLGYQTERPRLIIMARVGERTLEHWKQAPRRRRVGTPGTRRDRQTPHAKPTSAFSACAAVTPRRTAGPRSCARPKVCRPLPR